MITRLFLFLGICLLFFSCDSSVEPGEASYHNKILFTSSRGGTQQIYMMNPDGTGIQQLTGGSYSHWDGRWSPDAKQIVAGTGEDPTSMCSNMVLFYVDGTKRKLLGGGSQMAWSPDGRKIAFMLWPGAEMGDYTTYIYVTNLDSTDQIRLTDSGPGVFDGTPSWSPDGTSIAFTSQRDHRNQTGRTEIYLMNPDGGGQRRLTFIDSLVNTSPNWSPDGETIAFMSNGGVALINRDGSRLRYITHQYNDGLGGYFGPCWSPDGRHLVINWYSGHDPQSRIFLIDSGGTGLKCILDDSTAYATDWSR